MMKSTAKCFLPQRVIELPSRRHHNRFYRAEFFIQSLSAAKNDEKIARSDRDITRSKVFVYSFTSFVIGASALSARVLEMKIVR